MRIKRVSVAARLIICAVVGSALAMGAGPGVAVPAAYASSTWSVISSPNPPGTYSSIGLTSVSCVSSSFCMAVGSTLANGDHQAFAEKWDGSSWSLLTSLDSASSSILNGVSCVSPTWCVAVGADDAVPYGRAIVDIWDGSSWSLRPAPSPGSNYQTPSLTSISCVSEAYCVAAGAAQNINNLYQDQALVVWIDGASSTSWKVYHANQFAAATSIFSGISCTSAGICMAVGHTTGYNGVSSEQPLDETWNGISLSSPIPIPIPADSSQQFTGVSCTSPSWCMAAGSGTSLAGGGYQTLTESWNGTGWSPVPSPNPTGAANSFLTGISCLSRTSCVADGAINPSAFSSDQELIESWDGSSWAVDASPHPGTQSQLDGVSCAPGSPCFVVGGAVNQGSWQTLVESGPAPAPPGLSISVKVVDAPMPVDPATSAYVDLVATVTEGGTPAVGATVVANGPAPLQITGTTDASGQVTLLYPVSTGSASTLVVATLGNASASENVDAYSSSLEGTCQFQGAPSKLHALSSVLDYLIPEGDVSAYLEAFAHFLDVLRTGAGLAPASEQTTVYGYTITGQDLKPIYALNVEVSNAQTGANVSSSILYSHQSGLIQVTRGTGSGLPLQQIEQRLSCSSGPLA